jgi:putative FmdB family regulatory protein
MPTYSHVCENQKCLNEWEDFYSIIKDPPTQCPKCLQETAKRVIDGGVDKGIVRLTGNELTEKVKADAKQLERDASKSERVYSNILGEAKYHQLQTQMDRRGK